MPGDNETILIAALLSRVARGCERETRHAAWLGESLLLLSLSLFTAASESPK